MKARFPHLLPLLILALGVLLALLAPPVAQAAVFVLPTPDDALKQLTGWLQVATLAATGLAALAGIVIASIQKLKAQLKANTARLEEHAVQIAAAAPAPPVVLLTSAPLNPTPPQPAAPATPLTSAVQA